MIGATLYGPGNKEALPADWIAESAEIKADDGSWDLIFQTQADVDAYLAARKAAYLAAVEAKPVEPKPLTVDERLADIEARLAQLEK